jgi:hypothetical protein
VAGSIAPLLPIITAVTHGIFSRVNSGKVHVVTDDGDEPRELPDRDGAILYTEPTTPPDADVVY